MVDYTPDPIHEDIRDAVRTMCKAFPDEYWMEHDTNHEFPWEFYDAVAKGGWLGLTIPEEYGGGGLGVTEAAIVEQEISASGAGMGGCSAVHIGIFGFEPIIHHGTEDLKQRFLPRVVTGDLHTSFAVTEPDAGTDTTNISTFAKKVDGGWRVTGKKVWITKALEAERMLLLCRTSPREPGAKRTAGMTLMFAEMDRDHVTIRPIPKMGRNAVDTNELFIDDLFVADEDVVGEVGGGFKAILGGLNAERVISANAALGLGKAALRRGTQYAKERVVFGRPIGQNQGIAFQLAEAKIRIEAAEAVLQQGDLDGRPGAALRRRGQLRQVALCRGRLLRRRRRAPGARRVRLRQGVPRRAVLPRVPAHADRADQPGDGAELRQRARPGSARRSY